MKRQRHIRTHVMATLIGLTCGVLLVVILVFNLSIHGYIRARAAAQLDSMSQNAAEMWHGGMRDKRGMEPFLTKKKIDYDTKNYFRNTDTIRYLGWMFTSHRDGRQYGVELFCL